MPNAEVRDTEPKDPLFVSPFPSPPIIAAAFLSRRARRRESEAERVPVTMCVERQQQHYCTGSLTRGGENNQTDHVIWLCQPFVMIDLW